jgi:RHS repeat-associated protein
MRSYPYSGSSLSNPDAVTQILLTTGQSAPTIAFDNSGLGGNGTPASSLTFSYTTNSNTNGLIIVSVDEATTSPSCTSDKVTGVTNNGASLTDLGYYAKNSNGLAIKTYYGFAPATSTHNIVVSASASCIRYAAAATYTGVKQSGMPDASGSGNPLSSSGSVSLLQGTTTASYNAWAIMVGVPSTAGTATAGAGTTIRQQQSGEIYYADSGGPVFGPTGLSWSKGANADWASNYFSIAPLTSNPGVTATTSISYDNNGNVIQVGTTTFYTYDYLNRLTQSAIWNGNATTTSSYAYGPFGERVSQTTASSTTIYPNKLYSVITITNGATTTSTSTDYVYAGSNLFATIDQKLVNGTATGSPITRFNHIDNLGSTNVTSDSNMGVAQSFDYGPYGSVLATTNTGQTVAARGYIGQFSDSDGLSYLNARYYNSAQAQFTTQDPVFWGNPKNQNLQNPQSLNSYSYANDNPIVHSDPSGKYIEVSAGGTIPFAWINGQVGIRFNGDLSGAVVFAGGGAGYGEGFHVGSVSYTPGPVPQRTETNVVVGGDYLFGGASVSGKYVPGGTVPLQNKNWNGTLNFGEQYDWYLRKEVSVPVMGGLPPDGLMFGGSSTFSTPNYVPAPRTTVNLTSGSPSLSAYRSQNSSFGIPGVSAGGSQSKGGGGNAVSTWLGSFNPFSPQH